MRLMAPLPCAAADRRIAGVDAVRQPRQITRVGVGRVDARATSAVAHDRYGGGAHVNTLEQVKVHAERVGED